MGRRRETTDYLKECIADAMIKLLKNHTEDQFTVQDITELAGVGRTTYFRHFASKKDVLIYKLTLMWNRWAGQHPYEQCKTDYERALWFFSFCDSLSSLLELFFCRNLCDVLLDTFIRCIMPEHCEDQKTQYTVMFMAYGMYGIALNWIRNGFLETPEELAAICVGRES